MKRVLVRVMVLAALLAVAAMAWLVAPGPLAKGIVVGAVGCLALVLGGMAALTMTMRRRAGSELQPPPLPQSVWDYEMVLETLEGDPVHFSPGRVLILNFWATWCVPCVAEMPSLTRLAERTADLGVLTACVTQEDPDVVQRFVEKRAIEAPVYVLRGDPPDCFATRAIPATFVVDEDGTIALGHRGAAKWDADEVVTFVRGLAATP